MSTSAVDHGRLPEHMLGETAAGQPTETDPLIPDTRPRKKPFYRARPLWLVPFAISVSLVHGMTLASRIEVYTQLSCQGVYGHRPTLSNDQMHIIPPHAAFGSLNAQLYTPISVNTPTLEPTLSVDSQEQDGQQMVNPLHVSSVQCTSDPEVQSATARLQMLMTTIMGVLSALSTGWWGHFSERYGRTRVLALSTFAMFLADVIFILVSLPSSPLSRHGHRFLFLAPVIEGLSGSHGALQSATSAYISDCTSPGSRAYIFSRFAGATFLGIALGPSLGGWLIRHPIFWRASITSGRSLQTVASVFVIAAICSFLNFVLAALVLPESLSKEKQQRAQEEYVSSSRSHKGKARSRDEDSQALSSLGGSHPNRDDRCGCSGGLGRLFGPLTVFLPAVTYDPTTLRNRKDWSLTILAIGLFGYYLSQAMYQVNFLYAEHTYGWGAERLSYYISFLGGTRVLFLLFVLPSIISIFKPGTKGNKAPRVASTLSQGLIVERIPPSMSPVISPTIMTSRKGKKGVPLTRPHLAKEISFDLSLAKLSFLVEMMSDILIALIPTPAYTTHVADFMGGKKKSGRSSEMLFVMASSFTAFGSGVGPATQSLALCILQMRNLGSGDNTEADAGAGTLFGALAVLQAVGTTILGPILFGLVYSTTVARYPKAVFTLAAGILFGVIVLVMLIRRPSGTSGVFKVKKGKGKGRGRRYIDVERGRSRVSKDLRGGAIPNYSRL